MNTTRSQKRPVSSRQNLGTRAVLLQDEPYILEGKDRTTNRSRNHFRAFGIWQMWMVASVMISAGDLAAADDPDRLQPYAANPFYWQYKGHPVLLLGGSDSDARTLSRDRAGYVIKGVTNGKACLPSKPQKRHAAGRAVKGDCNEKN